MAPDPEHRDQSNKEEKNGSHTESLDPHARLTVRDSLP